MEELNEYECYVYWRMYVFPRYGGRFKNYDDGLAKNECKRQFPKKLPKPFKMWLVDYRSNFKNG